MSTPKEKLGPKKSKPERTSSRVDIVLDLKTLNVFFCTSRTKPSLSIAMTFFKFKRSLYSLVIFLVHLEAARSERCAYTGFVHNRVDEDGNGLDATSINGNSIESDQLLGFSVEGSSHELRLGQP